MFTFLLILAFLAVLLSPIALDLYLTFKEARMNRPARPFQTKKDPRLAWASSRSR